MARKVIKREFTRNYVVEDYRDPPKKEVKGYRTKRLPDGTLVTVAIMRKPGPRGGRTKIVNLKKPRGKRDESR